MKKAVMITLFLFLSFFIGTSFAVEVTLFGPNQYVRTTGPANVYTDTFSAIPGEARLIVKNGDWDGSQRVTDAISSASVVVNGEQIFGPDDFNQQVHILETTVNLAEDNSITVELASNPGSYLTIQVTQQAEFPTVTISAVPESIQAGGSSTLSWNSTNADSATIDQSIGTVPVDGSTTVSPTETTTYTITASGAGGTAAASVTVTVISAISLQITSPDEGEIISRPDTLVRGTVTNVTGNETGVTVNGIVAIVYGNQFVANHIPLQEGQNTITASATDTDGNTATASLNVNAVTTEDYIKITADTESGISPLETTLKVEGSFGFTESSLSYTGPGVVEVLENPSPEEYRVRMTTEGIYYLTAEVTDSQSIAYTDTVAIVVLNQAELDTLLRAKWDGMKAALITGDVEGAISFHHGVLKNEYESIYNLIGSDLPILVQQMQDVEPVYAKGDRAKYRIKQDHTVEGQTVTITYYIYFSRDGSGLWKIEKY